MDIFGGYSSAYHSEGYKILKINVLKCHILGWEDVLLSRDVISACITLQILCKTLYG